MQPIFVSGKSKIQNCQTGYRKDFSMDKIPGSAVLTIGAQTFYRLYINGKRVMHGPARSPEGFQRYDTVDILPYLTIGINRIAVEVSSYNYGCYYVPKVEGFLCAKLIIDDRELLCTDTDWRGITLTQRDEKAEFYAHSRARNESYHMDETYEAWRTQEVHEPVEIVENAPIKYMPRGVLLPDMEDVEPRICGIFDYVTDENIMPVQEFFIDDPDHIAGFEDDNRPAFSCSKLKPAVFSGTFIDDTLSIKATAGIFFDLMKMYSGFPHVHFTIDRDMTVDIIHGDRLKQTNGMLHPRGGHTNNVIRLVCKKGTYDFTAFEPYGIRWMNIIFHGEGIVKLHHVSLVTYQYPDLDAASFICSDGDLNRIFESAKTTFLTNTLDVFMDCPGRERGGWFCDSFFTGRSERFFCGNSVVNRAMLEDAVLSKKTIGEFFPQLYPAETDYNRVGLIPNWSMFVFLQFFEYYKMTKDDEFLAFAKDRMLRSVEDLEQYENSIGLLENLPGFVFMDWSLANSDEYKSPVSVPTNAMYAKVLDCAAELYGITKWREKADKIRHTLSSLAVISKNECSYYADGLIPTDQGYINNGKISEASLYYDLWLGLPDPGNLWEILKKEHGPCPACYPSNLFVGRSNVFIGLYLRMELLAQQNETTQLLKEMRHLFCYMIDKGPGTLWENLSDGASVDHGFASHAAVLLIRDVLGIGIPDETEKTVTISPKLGDLSWARGSIKTPHGLISVSVWKENDEVKSIISVPEAYKIIS